MLLKRLAVARFSAVSKVSAKTADTRASGGNCQHFLLTPLLTPCATIPRMLDGGEFDREELIEQLRTNVARSRELREQALDLLQTNADLREFLRETVLMSIALREALHRD